MTGALPIRRDPWHGACLWKCPLPRRSRTGTRRQSGWTRSGKHQPCGGIDIFRDDGIGMMGAVPVDVIDGFLHAGDDFHGKDEIEVFMAEVIVFDDI